MSPCECFKPLDIAVDVCFIPYADECPGPFDGIKAINNHEQCVRVPVLLVLFDKCLSVCIDCEYSLILLVCCSVVDVPCCCEVSVL